MIRAIGIATAASLLLLFQPAPADAASIVTEWLDDVVPLAKEMAWEPTTGARFFAIVHTAMYDAWTAYDPVAVGCVTGSLLKGQGGSSNEANKREAISYAAFTVLWTLAPQHRRSLVERMQALGYGPNAETPAAKVGRRAALAVLAARVEDGANQALDFSDTTGYAPRNSGEPDAWQPTDEFGRRQLPLTPQWGRVMPFALKRADQFRPAPPPAPGSADWSSQIETLIGTSGALTDAQKAAAEYWGFFGMAPAPQLFELARFASNSNDQRLDDDVKLFFAVSNAILDASIATWESKYVYDYVRPITVIHALGDTVVTAWRPRGLPVAFAYSTPLTRDSVADNSGTPAGIAQIRAAEWQPYLSTPAFPAYVSGHSSFTAAWARVMELATGRHELNFRKTVTHLYVEQRELAEPVVLDYPTFASAAEASGISRIWAGIHWPADNDRGQELGREVGENSWQYAQQLFLGTASPATAALLALRPPFWFHESLTPDHPVHFGADGGSLTWDLSSGAKGDWQSILLDAMPAGDYQLKLAVAATGDSPVRLVAAVIPSQSGGAVGISEAIVQPTGTFDAVTISWANNGLGPFRIQLEASVEAGSAKVQLSSVGLRRIWPMRGGSPRYYEMSGASLPDR